MWLRLSLRLWLRLRLLTEQRDTLSPPPRVQKNGEEEENAGTIDNLFL